MSSFFLPSASLGLMPGRCPHGVGSSGCASAPPHAAAVPSPAAGMAVEAAGSSRAPSPPFTFPASRSHLWDRTSNGTVTVVDLKNMPVQVRLAPSTWPVLQQLQQHLRQQTGADIRSQSRPAAQLMAILLHNGSTTRGLSVELTVTPAAHQAAAAVLVPLHFGTALPDAAAMQLCSDLEVAASRVPAAAGLANLLAACLTCHAESSGALMLQGLAATPAPILDFKPLLSKRVATLQLAQRLQDQLQCPLTATAAACDASEEHEDGFLTLDRSRSLVPLPACDAAANSLPLVGVWVAVAADIKHPLVAAACLRFFSSKALADRATSIGPFLLLLYSRGRATVPLCYEVHITLEGGVIPMLARRFNAVWHPEQAASTSINAVPCTGLHLPGCPVAPGRTALPYAGSSGASCLGHKAVGGAACFAAAPSQLPGLQQLSNTMFALQGTTAPWQASSTLLATESTQQMQYARTSAMGPTVDSSASSTRATRLLGGRTAEDAATSDEAVVATLGASATNQTVEHAPQYAPPAGYDGTPLPGSPQAVSSMPQSPPLPQNSTQLSGLSVPGFGTSSSGEGDSGSAPSKATSDCGRVVICSLPSFAPWGSSSSSMPFLEKEFPGTTPTLVTNEAHPEQLGTCHRLLQQQPSVLQSCSQGSEAFVPTPLAAMSVDTRTYGIVLPQPGTRSGAGLLAPQQTIGNDVAVLQKELFAVRQEAQVRALQLVPAIVVAATDLPPLQHHHLPLQTASVQHHVSGQQQAQVGMMQQQWHEAPCLLAGPADTVPPVEATQSSPVVAGPCFAAVEPSAAAPMAEAYAAASVSAASNADSDCLANVRSSPGTAAGSLHIQPAWTEAEAAIDRLIAEAEHAVSSTSCYDANPGEEQQQQQQQCGQKLQAQQPPSPQLLEEQVTGLGRVDVAAAESVEESQSPEEARAAAGHSQITLLRVPTLVCSSDDGADDDDNDEALAYKYGLLEMYDRSGSRNGVNPGLRVGSAVGVGRWGRYEED